MAHPSGIAVRFLREGFNASPHGGLPGLENIAHFFIGHSTGLDFHGINVSNPRAYYCGHFTSVCRA
jgi:hypothetical protein